ncbi:MAG: hypothetical protein A2W11_02795 [Ignavibacteria bacterium RBG_16_35_7]|nr:MAG: hypothetical protein A2W11_02795 [Ignavibacteria bacterium RBG_16_35_7]
MYLKTKCNFYLLIILLGGIISCNGNQEIQGLNYEGIIFHSKDYTPDLKTVSEMEINLNQFLKTTLSDSVWLNVDSNRRNQLIFVVNNSSKYKRRYSGSLNAKTEKIIRIEFFLLECIPKGESWKNQELKIHDGGECCWNLFYNTTTKTFFDFNINSNG